MSGSQDGGNVVSTLDSTFMSQLIKNVAMATPTRYLKLDIKFTNSTSALQRTLTIHGPMVALIQNKFDNKISDVCYTGSI